MSTVAKVFVVLNLLLAVAFLGAAATHLGYDDSYRKKLTDVTAQKDQEIGRLNGLITEANREKANLQEQKNDATAHAAADKSRAETFKQAHDEIVQVHNSK